jgi:hypothetical protein
VLCRICCFVVLAFAIALPLPFAQAGISSECVLAGRITNTPTTGIAVRLRRLEKDPLAINDGYSASVAADGRFRFEDVAPGKYVVVAEGGGFMLTEYGAAAPVAKRNSDRVESRAAS